MSRFFSSTHSSLIPYTPGEQPKDKKYIKLNTNESPYPPSDLVCERVELECKRLMLYPDPDCCILREKLAEKLGVDKDEVVVTNGSDEILNFAFLAFSDSEHPVVFPDLTYGFYSVFAKLYNLPYEEIPLDENFNIRVEDYIGINKNIFIPNPNAPTGIALPLSDIEKIVASNPESVVVIDEAYVAFGAESAVKLIDKYDNLIVTRTFSKSRSMAGGRLGFGVGNRELMSDINTLRYSTNPYNINRLTMEAGIAVLDSDEYYLDNCERIVKTREKTGDLLKKMGFQVLDSKANFLFAKSDKISGKELYEKLRERGILVRHFEKPRIKDFNRITVGTEDEMNTLVSVISEILKER